MKVGDLASSVGKGLFAGAIGTAAMRVSSTLEMKARGRAASTAPADAAGKVLGVEPKDEGGGPLRNPCPLGLRDRLGRRPSLISAAGLEGTAATAAQFGAVWGSEQVMVPALGVAPPFWTWGAKEVGIDAFHHLVYAGATGAAYALLDLYNRRPLPATLAEDSGRAFDPRGPSALIPSASRSRPRSRAGRYEESQTTGGPTMTERNTTPHAAEAGTFALGGDLEVNRLGFGAMRITGEGIWGEPENPEEAERVLRRCVELGINLIDTADSYGPDVSERLIGETLAPYPDDVVIATKAGLVRPGPGDWRPNGRPEHIRGAIEGSLRRLKLETIDLYQLHRIDPDVPAEESLGTMSQLRDEGKVRHVGLSEVGVDDLRRAQEILPISSVQNRYNLTDRGSEAVLEACEADGIAFIPWFPLASGSLSRPGGPVDEIATNHDATPGQVALAWLLRRSPVMLPIPGTSSVVHLEENVAAASLELADDEYAELSEVSG